MAPPAVARVLERVRATVRKHELFVPGSTVVVACSGGPDSICLLHAMVRLRRLFRVRLAVFHFDHRLRSDSGDDAGYARRQADRLNLPFVLHEAIDRPEPGASVEAWARLARYGALTQAAADLGADRAVVGHTLDDQAETILLGLVRGGGLEVLAGMAPVARVPPLGLEVARPLLETSRQEVEAFNRALRLRPREDPSNRDPRFLRNRVRLELLPYLESKLDRNLKVTLARTGEHVRADAEFLEGVASDAARSITAADEQEVRLHARSLAELPPSIGARVVRQALRLAGAVAGEWGPDPGAAHVRGVLDLAAGRSGRRLDLPGGLLAVRTKEYVRIARASPETAMVDRIPRRHSPGGRHAGAPAARRGGKGRTRRKGGAS
jgi:tRNA(Ile)-lysidine synthase